MEIKFDHTSCRCLKCLTDQLQHREQTQEVRLPETMPDIGRVLGCWGQVILRGKEWRSGSMGANGGVMARVLYAPEDGTAPRSVEAWIPFQMKWDLPDTQRDGSVWVDPKLVSIDARSTSARKLMVRATVSARGQALDCADQPVFSPRELPEDVQVLQNTYPMELPVEFGEKMFQVEEELEFPGDQSPVEHILNFAAVPQITEQKIVGSRLVFRGKLLLQVLYWADGGIRRWETEVPFSQFAELDRDHSPQAVARILPVLTDSELECVDGKLVLKVGIAAQFLIYEREMVKLTEDAYSPVRPVSLQTEPLELPARLDQWREPVTVTKTVPAEVAKILDINWIQEHPQDGEEGAVGLPGMFQVLFYDPEGELQCTTIRYDLPYAIQAGENARVEIGVSAETSPVGSITADGMEITAEIMVETAVFANGTQPMVTGLELGAVTASDPNRPSLILCRCTDQSLWTLAKESGSTVDAICKANGLSGEPASGQMLLIPVT